MGAIEMAASTSLSYSQWWVTWLVLAVFFGPLVTIWSKDLGRQWAWLPAVLAVVLLSVGLLLVSIAGECNSWPGSMGSVKPSGCHNGAYRMRGWLGVFGAAGAFAGAIVMLSVVSYRRSRDGSDREDSDQR